MPRSAIKKKLIECYEYLYESARRLRLRVFYHLRIMTPDQTLAYIEKHRCSIARFGDGEFDHILELKDEGFQDRTKELTQALSEVFQTKDQRLLLCIPRCMNTVEECGEHAAAFWIEWGKNGHHDQIIQMIRKHAGSNYRFGDSQITRPYIDWKTAARANRLFPKLRHLWENRELLIVEGDQTRMGVGNDLFDNAAGVKRILCPASNAYSYYSQIKEEICSHYSGELIVMALGPTATVLAAELSQLDMQALDIGNIDIEYEWYLRGAKERIPIPGKYTNEAKNGIGRIASDCRDEKYLSQIVARVGC